MDGCRCGSRSSGWSSAAASPKDPQTLVPPELSRKQVTALCISLQALCCGSCGFQPAKRLEALRRNAKEHMTQLYSCNRTDAAT